MKGIDMTNNPQYGIELLISYYKNLITLNDRFTAFNKQHTGTNIINSENDKYKNLLDKLIATRQLIIDKEIADIDKLHKPAPGLFTDKEHLNTLEATIQFYKDNPYIDYDTSGAEQYFNDDAPINNNSVDNALKFNEQISNSLNQALSTMGNEIKMQLSDIQEPIKKLVNDDLYIQMAKYSNDTLAVLTTNYELIKSDIKKYDTFLTEHISKSGINVTEAIEKEHIRFAQKIASESNNIIKGVSGNIASEIAKQTDLIKDSMKILDDKTFKQGCILYIASFCALFACSILSSTWAANKVLSSTKIVRVETICKSTTPVNSRKTNTR